MPGNWLNTSQLAAGIVNFREFLYSRIAYTALARIARFPPPPGSGINAFGVAGLGIVKSNLLSVYESRGLKITQT